MGIFFLNALFYKTFIMLQCRMQPGIKPNTSIRATTLKDVKANNRPAQTVRIKEIPIM